MMAGSCLEPVLGEIPHEGIEPHGDARTCLEIHDGVDDTLTHRLPYSFFRTDRHEVHIVGYT